MRRIVCIATVLFMIITLFSGCALLQKLGLQDDDSDDLTPVSSIAINEADSQQLNSTVPIHLYFVSEDGSKLKLEVRHIPITEAKKSVNNLASIIVKELIKGPAKGSALKQCIPNGTKLRTSVSIKSGVATVDLSKEFVENHPGGETAEKLTLYSVVNSLTELKDIQKVKFTINGVTQNEYKGNFRLDAPFPRSASIISKIPTAVNPSPTGNAKTLASPTATPKSSAVESPKPTAGKSGDSAASGDNNIDTGGEAFYNDILE